MDTERAQNPMSYAVYKDLSGGQGLVSTRIMLELAVCQGNGNRHRRRRFGVRFVACEPQVGKASSNPHGHCIPVAFPCCNYG
jgi:hypothetical protein